MQPNTEQKCWMYEHMLVSRYFEEAIEKAYLEGKTPAFNMANGRSRARCIYPTDRSRVRSECAHISGEPTSSPRLIVLTTWQSPRGSIFDEWRQRSSARPRPIRWSRRPHAHFRSGCELLLLWHRR